MRRVLLFSLLILPFSTAAREAATPGRDWPQFRGIASRGVSEGAATASAWNVPAGERVKWKTAIPGLGHSSPIVYGDLTSVPAREGVARIKFGPTYQRLQRLARAAARPPT